MLPLPHFFLPFRTVALAAGPPNSGVPNPVVPPKAVEGADVRVPNRPPGVAAGVGDAAPSGVAPNPACAGKHKVKRRLGAAGLLHKHIANSLTAALAVANSFLAQSVARTCWLRLLLRLPCRAPCRRLPRLLDRRLGPAPAASVAAALLALSLRKGITIVTSLRCKKTEPGVACSATNACRCWRAPRELPCMQVTAAPTRLPQRRGRAPAAGPRGALRALRPRGHPPPAAWPRRG